MIRVVVSGLSVSVCAKEHAVEIAAGVYMPLANLGGCDGLYSNYSLWLELGGRGLDTALSYVVGDVQPKLGAAVRGSAIPRSELFITTKIPCCPSAWDAMGPYYCDAHPRDVPRPDEDVDATLRAIGIDYVDLLLLHWPCERFEDTVATYKGLERALRQGKTRSIGISNFNASAIEALLRRVDVKPAFNQCSFGVAGHAKEETLLGADDVSRATCAARNITYGAYSPLQQGNALWNSEVMVVAKAHNRSEAEIALRWIVQQGHPFISASTKATHDIEDLAVFEFALNDAEMTRLSSAAAAPMVTMYV